MEMEEIDESQVVATPPKDSVAGTAKILIGKQSKYASKRSTIPQNLRILVVTKF